MVRQSYRTNPAQKHLEVFQNFSGGMNSVSDRAVLADHEFSDLVNMDINPRGTISRRKGFSNHIVSRGTGQAQGFFRLYLDNNTIHEITAQGGKLYLNDEELPIVGLEEGFQTDRFIEAAQYRKKLYIATGTKLVVYDGETAEVVEPYRPDPLEALYVGTNGLAENPDEYMEDGEATFLRLDGVTFSSRYGIINEPVTITGYVSKPEGSTIEFKFQHKLEVDVLGDWKDIQDWSTDRSVEFVSDEVGDHQFRIYARIQGTVIGSVEHYKDIEDEFPSPSVDDLVVVEGNDNSSSFYRWTGAQWKHENAMEYLVPKYTFKPAPDEDDETVPVDDIQLCNRIMVYWDRLYLYGCPTQMDAIFISHLHTPDYFPVPNSLTFDNVEQEGITKLVRYRDMLLAFTPNSIQALQGTSPLDFVRTVFQTNIGCISPFGTASINNHVAFISNDGVYIMKSIGYSENRANVEKIDLNISNHITTDPNISLVSTDNQLHVVIPNENKRLRFYYSLGEVWTKDESPIIDFINVYNFNGALFFLRENGDVIKPDDVYRDVDYAYADAFETKDFTFWQPNHIKKLKEFQISLVGTGDLYMNLYADDREIISSVTEHAVIDDLREVAWEIVEKPNLRRSITKFGEWVLGESAFGVPDRIGKVKISGKCRRTRARVEHRGEEENELIGLAYVFKLKKP